MIKGLIFDLDGIITDTAIFHFQAWKKVVEKFNINLTIEINEKIKGIPREETLLAIFKIFKYDFSDLTKLEIDNLCIKKNALYLNLIKEKLNKNSILPGIQKLLDEAKKQRLKMAIASSSKNALLILKKLEIKNYFDYIVNPDNVQNPKPSPEIYLLAAQGIYVKPSECIGFEDAQIGIKGLNDAKIFSVGINPGDSYVKLNSRYFLNSTVFLDLKKIIAAAANRNLKKNSKK